MNSDASEQSKSVFLGLAPFLRMSIAGTDIRPVGEAMLSRAGDCIDDANLWMNLSTVMLCLGQRDTGLAIQWQALQMQRVFHRPSVHQPAALRLLVVAVPGDLAANTPIDCLLENSDIDLNICYVSESPPLLAHIPEHDVLMVAISEADENRGLLSSLAETLIDWPVPVINAPQYIPAVERNTASVLLQNISGLLMPPTLRVSREQLLEIAIGNTQIQDLFASCNFPIILRPIGSHAGRDLEKIQSSEDVAAYLAYVAGDEFFISRFIDYSSADGLFRKFRIALIDGKAYACHMAVSSHWMLHYVNAGMYEDAQKRAEEAIFMAHFDDFIQRHRVALAAIYQRTKLDYLCIDCAETQDGELLIFEIDHAMVVHAMDSEELFPYKQHHMQKIQLAFRDFLLRIAAATAANRLM